jgi:NAD(P)-dependent dehydrogenase (short-subunit alcohol dehydrogenase family)
MKVLLADIDQRALDETKDVLLRAGAEVEEFQTDVAKQDSVDALAEFAYRRFGQVHILCNNAGILPPDRFRHVWEFPLQDWERSLSVNFMGVVHGLRSFVPKMLASNVQGHIVNTASIGGLTSGAWSTPYGAAKHALIRITEALYASFMSMNAGIGVTAFCPGLVSSGMADGEGLLSADDAADMAIDAIRANQLYLLTTNAYDEAIKDRIECVLDRRNPVFSDIRNLYVRERSGRSDGIVDRERTKEQR